MSTIEQKRADVEKRFNELQTEGERKRQEVNQIEDQLKELRGQYAAFTSLLTEDPAKTVEAVEAAPEASSGKRK